MSYEENSWDEPDPARADGLFAQPNATLLSGDAYTSAEIFAKERRTVFFHSWACIAAASDVPNPGDVCPVSLAGMPLLLLRDRAGELRVFHNICSHRGLQLVTEAESSHGCLTCPYHAWTYDLDGTLKATPHFGGYGQHECGGFDRRARSLRPVRAEQWLDLVFVNLSGAAPPLSEYVRAVAARFAPYDFSLLRRSESASFEFGANWKLAVENFSESYHLPWMHPQLNSNSRMEDHYAFDVGSEHVGQGSKLYKTGCIDGRHLPTFPDLASERATVADYVSLFPNLMLGVHPDYFLAILVDPIAPDRSTERMIFYFVGDAAMQPEYEALRRLPVDLWKLTNAEDIVAIERLQVGRHSPAFDGGCFSPALETTVLQFQQLVQRSLSGDRAS